MMRAYFERVVGDEMTSEEVAAALPAVTVEGKVKKIKHGTVRAIRTGAQPVTLAHLASLARYQKKSGVAVLIDLVSMAINQPSSLVEQEGKAGTEGVRVPGAPSEESRITAGTVEVVKRTDGKKKGRRPRAT